MCSERQIPFSPPDISEEEIQQVIRVLKSGWITTGPKTKRFEQKIAEFCRTKKAVCLSSATACLEMTLRILGIGPGDEVITSAYTYTASASVIAHVGAVPVLVDVAKGSYEMDYTQLEHAITERTKAVIPVDLAGIMCDYDRIYDAVYQKKELFHPQNDLQKAFGRVVIIADAAHSFGAARHGMLSGQAADFTCFSFHAVKNLTTAEGGAVTWRGMSGIDYEELYRKYMLLSLHGQDRDAFSKREADAWEYDIISLAYKCNMTDVAAAIGLGQLDRYEEMLSRREKVIGIYNEGLKDLKVQVLNHFGPAHRSNGHLYLTRLTDKSREYCDIFMRKLAQKGISSNVHYKPLPMHTAYKNMGFRIENYPNAYEMFENEVTLPLNSKMTEDDAYYVAETIKRILKD